MGAIDPDLVMLERSAQAALHAAKQAALHTLPEYDADMPGVMKTLVQDGPYGWMIFPQVTPEGRIKLPIMTTRDEVRQAYEATWAMVRMLAYRPTIELRGSWYFFQEAISTTRLSGREALSDGESVCLMTAANATVSGITGEIVWARVPQAMLGRSGPEAPIRSGREFRRGLLEQHDRYVAMLRAGDAEGVAETLDDEACASVRDYVNDTGALVGLEGKAAFQAHLRSFFEIYEPISVDVLDRIAQEWYLFAELRFTAKKRSGGDGGEIVSFHTAEIFAPACDGRFIACLGHGTDPR